MGNAPAPADDPFTAWLNGFDAAADHLLAIGVERDVVVGLAAILQVINLRRMEALVQLRRDVLDAALDSAPMVETA